MSPAAKRYAAMQARLALQASWVSESDEDLFLEEMDDAFDTLTDAERLEARKRAAVYAQIMLLREKIGAVQRQVDEVWSASLASDLVTVATRPRPRTEGSTSVVVHVNFEWHGRILPRRQLVQPPAAEGAGANEIAVRSLMPTHG